MKWLTSGSHRLKANLNRSFGARKTKKAAAVAARKHDVRFKSILSSNKAAKSTRLRIARKKAITRTEQLDDKPVMLPSEMHIDFHRPPTAVATTMNPLQLRNHMPFGEHNESSRAQLIARRKEELIQPYFTRNRTPASHVAQAVYEILPRERFTGGSTEDEHYQYRREQQLRKTRDAFTKQEQPMSESGKRTNNEQEAHFKNLTPIIDNTHYHYQPPQQSLRFFNNGVEVDMGEIPLPSPARLESL